MALLLLLGACSPVMEASRPDPVDLTRFKPGDMRMQVVSELGDPNSTEVYGLNSCDLYQLYTKGPSAVGKGAIAAGEAVADVATFGITEVLFTPAEAATKNSKHTVMFCYDGDARLDFIRESTTHVDN